MAFFSQELFEVFEEKSEPVSLTGKKRKRGGVQGEKERDTDKKRSKGEAASSTDHVKEKDSPQQQPSVAMVDLTAEEEGQPREEEAM